MMLQQNCCAFVPCLEKAVTVFFFSLYVFGEPEVHFRNFLLCCPSQMSARSQVPSQVATHQEISSQLWAGETLDSNPGLQDNSLARYHWATTPPWLSHHASLLSHHASLLSHHASLLSHHASLLSHHASLLVAAIVVYSQATVLTQHLKPFSGLGIMKYQTYWEYL
jgi:hypothetical protein